MLVHMIEMGIKIHVKVVNASTHYTKLNGTDMKWRCKTSKTP